MTTRVNPALLAHLADVLKDWSELKSKPARNVADAEATRFTTSVRAVVERVAGARSAYMDQVLAVLEQPRHVYEKAMHVGGVLESLHDAAASGYLDSASELLRGELFADFLEMAQHLLDEGYKDPAAVVAGSSLEAHLRQLCTKFAVDTEVTVNGDLRPKKADVLNADLVKAGAFNKLDQKSVTSWLDLRNNAAHGHYGAYQSPQVALMISGVRDFIVRNPA